MKNTRCRRYGWNTCDNCGREFNVTKEKDVCWDCPWCDYDNKPQFVVPPIPTGKRQPGKDVSK